MTGDLDFTVDEVVANLGLLPLHGGGWGRDMATADPTTVSEQISAYRLLTPALAEWRSIETEEIWTAYMGASIQVEVKTDEASEHGVIQPGQGTWITIPPGCWLRLKPLGDWSLAGRIGVVDLPPT